MRRRRLRLSARSLKGVKSRRELGANGLLTACQLCTIASILCGLPDVSFVWSSRPIELTSLKWELCVVFQAHIVDIPEEWELCVVSQAHMVLIRPAFCGSLAWSSMPVWFSPIHLFVAALCGLQCPYGFHLSIVWQLCGLRSPYSCHFTLALSSLQGPHS